MQFKSQLIEINVSMLKLDQDSFNLTGIYSSFKQPVQVLFPEITLQCVRTITELKYGYYVV